MHDADSEDTTSWAFSAKNEVRKRATQSADNTASSFVDSSAQYRGMRPNLIAMKNNNSQSQTYTRLVVPSMILDTMLRRDTGR